MEKGLNSSDEEDSDDEESGEYESDDDSQEEKPQEDDDFVDDEGPDMARTGDNGALREIKPLNPAQEALLNKAFDGGFLENMRKLRELRERNYKEHEMRE